MHAKRLHNVPSEKNLWHNQAGSATQCRHKTRSGYQFAETDIDKGYFGHVTLMSSDRFQNILLHGQRTKGRPKKVDRQHRRELHAMT